LLEVFRQAVFGGADESGGLMLRQTPKKVQYQHLTYELSEGGNGGEDGAKTVNSRLGDGPTSTVPYEPEME
jgi:hypothetical protein